MINMKIEGDGIIKFAEAVVALGSASRANRALAMALNRTGGKVLTQVKRAVAKQAGVSQRDAVRYGNIRPIKAFAGRLEYRVASSGRALPTRIFKARPTASGVSAAPWATRRMFPGTFFVKGIGGHVFKRTGKFNKNSERKNAIERHWGPRIPRELVRDETAEAFHRVVKRELPKEVARAINVLTKGVVK